ncbi:hypothetical protein [Bacillus toyonensis]|uniref:hypothetical protein n=1 Tax=Bacillus toyonensis TaxID=155322 RepID=UPI000BEBB390|nr:hypothetical protein [Bacillus toyonensis]PEB20359.1 hypothetical protein COO08_02290 [Bacillus toyonensis]PEF99869.1 hypothetical protein COO01_05780 [Bacillus toyonensis]PHD95042.1 hypothetical protein COF55_01320 [Bacillus toyonensis]
MDWIKIITLGIAVFTLVVSIYNAITLNQNKKKDRRIAVELSEKRRMQNDLMKHITEVLDLGRRGFKEKEENEKQKIYFQLLNHKPFIWINLDRENRSAKKLRENCNEYIFWCTSFLDSSNETERSNFEKDAEKNKRFIWKLLDEYIEVEDELIKDLI